MIPADDGGSATPSGPQTLKVEPASIPGARDAFLSAADQVDLLVGRLLRTTPSWAGDPVSRETAQQFDSGSAGGGGMGQRAAVDALKAYGQQLRDSGNALNDAYNQYVAVEGANTAKWKGKPEPA
ncbi:hypothetical protein [Actinocrispum wychmicini]|uniref:Excreted virulence factor EspC (Type VII ESX diderm) n=1 Tax=Actinocrispum wychmicini TaxID=1213861 RepID=A0A4R2K593_9PSEU|nr:hypothetical protein [Actinocrispum wychmicini]TCO65006.1 hypothetical protein EV192_101790 [Actinocrispum wychmicini]